MKKHICFLLALVMVLSLFAGCGQPSAEDPAVQGSPADTEQPAPNTPPRRAEELVPRLNAELKAQNIPLEFIYQGEYSTQFQNEAGEWEPSCFGLYQAAFTDSGDPVKTETFDLSVDYWSEPTEPMLKLQIWVADEATDREREMHKTVCAIAAQLCDEQMGEEKVGELFAAAPAPTHYIAKTGSFGSFTYKYDPYGGTDSDYDYSVVLCQSGDLTHTLSRKLSSKEEWYELHFVPAEELVADRFFPAPSVAELEQRINDAFVTLGVPITCQLLPDTSYGRWSAVFRWSTLEDPDYAYPEFPYEEYIGYGYQPEEITDEFIAQYLNNQIAWANFTVDALDPVRKDAPVSYISFWDAESIPELAEVICLAIDPEKGAEDIPALQSIDPVEGTGSNRDYQVRTLQKDDYSITQDTYTEDGSVHTSINYSKYKTWNVQEPTGEALLDPALLDYEFQLEGPAVEGKVFNFEQGYQTYFNGSSYEYVDWAGVLNDFLQCTRSGVSVESTYYIDSQGLYRFYTGIYAADYSGDDTMELDRGVFNIRDFDLNEEPWGTFELYMVYNTNVAQYLTEGMNQIGLENLLRVPIGLSLMLDEAMTAEEAIRLHTHAMEYDYIATKEDYDRGIAMEGYQVTVYGTGDVIHLLTEDPKTGENTYSAIVRAYAESSPGYNKLVEYLDD